MADLFSADSGAVFSLCRRYRYRLWRVWDASLPIACFVLMNCSTADEVSNDPTIERCVRRVTQWGGFGGVIIVNAFAWRETDSRKLPGLIAQGVDIIGPENDAAILEAAKGAQIVVCGRGAPGELGGRGRKVAEMLHAAGIDLHALKINDDGSPGHPLYIGYSVAPIPYRSTGAF